MQLENLIKMQMEEQISTNIPNNSEKNEQGSGTCCLKYLVIIKFWQLR